MNIILKEKLEDGCYYLGSCRNTNIARWNKNEFYYWRTKWGNTFLETIKHPEDELHFDVFEPYEKVINPIIYIPLTLGVLYDQPKNLLDFYNAEW